jgi:hypothetical protein
MGLRLFVVAALAVCGWIVGLPTRAAEGAGLAVLAAPLPGPLARLEPRQHCPSQNADARDPPPVVVLQDRRRFRVGLEAGSIALEPMPLCATGGRPTPPGILAGTRAQSGSGTLRQVWLADPSQRYRHAIFETPENATSVRALTATGTELRYSAPPDAVIEDRSPRLVQAWGQDAVLTVQSTIQGGAAVLVLGIVGDQLQRLAESVPIGTPQRWLNPIGVADFDGDGATEVAAVVTPHIGGSLTLYRRDRDRLTVAYSEPGFSNHAIGTDELRLATMLDVNGDGVVDLAVPGADRRTLRIVTFSGGRFRELQRFGHSAVIRSALLAVDLDRDGKKELVYALADGTLVALTARRR